MKRRLYDNDGLRSLQIVSETWGMGVAAICREVGAIRKLQSPAGLLLGTTIQTPPCCTGEDARHVCSRTNGRICRFRSDMTFSEVSAYPNLGFLSVSDLCATDIRKQWPFCGSAAQPCSSLQKGPGYDERFATISTCTTTYHRSISAPRYRTTAIHQQAGVYLSPSQKSNTTNNIASSLHTWPCTKA